jgi:hypothetical protein
MPRKSTIYIHKNIFENSLGANGRSAFSLDSKDLAMLMIWLEQFNILHSLARKGGHRYALLSFILSNKDLSYKMEGGINQQTEHIPHSFYFLLYPSLTEVKRD